MFPIFPVIEPTIAGLKIIGGAISGELSSLITKNVAKTIWNIIKFLLLLAVVIIISFLKSITVDFFSNIKKYWKQDSAKPQNL